jgi:hypothetical protein
MYTAFVWWGEREKSFRVEYYYDGNEKRNFQ